MYVPKKLILGAMLLAAPLAVAQTAMQSMPAAMGSDQTQGSQAVPQTADGARPGNDIGTRNSLPLSPSASNITSQDTNAPIAPTPPAPPVAPGSSAGALISAAGQSLAANQTGTADEALEQAETNILQRSVVASTPTYRSGDPVVTQIEIARDDIGNHDTAGAKRVINEMLSSNAPELAE